MDNLWEDFNGTICIAKLKKSYDSNENKVVTNLGYRYVIQPDEMYLFTDDDYDKYIDFLDKENISENCEETIIEEEPGHILVESDEEISDKVREFLDENFVKPLKTCYTPDGNECFYKYITLDELYEFYEEGYEYFLFDDEICERHLHSLAAIYFEMNNSEERDEFWSKAFIYKDGDKNILRICENAEYADLTDYKIIGENENYIEYLSLVEPYYFTDDIEEILGWNELEEEEFEGETRFIVIYKNKLSESLFYNMKEIDEYINDIKSNNALDNVEEKIKELKNHMKEMAEKNDLTEILEKYEF
ncbi:hypothetical protein [Marinitoga litoralis]|uniref:hypothetical protein n=1 Tax=Marinitoga litoralis TaxID=570855 RepID=UPI0019618F97|nr:hypothetical protein [Marinitoga litoralis]MBM7559988.1 hypothetical protein [Marinitoga litoralis]